MRDPSRIVRAGVRLAFVSCLVGMLATGELLATTYRPSGLGEKVRRAMHVVHARVVENSARQGPEGGYTYTITRFEILTSAKGAARPGETLELRLIGGHVPGAVTATVVPGIPRFGVGETVVLFTEERGGRQLLVGLDGVLRVAPGERGPRVLAPPIDRTFDDTLESVPAELQRANRRTARSRQDAAKIDAIRGGSTRNPVAEVRLDAFLADVRRIAAEDER